MKNSHSVYLHIPFCQKRCTYCDFNTFSGMDHLIAGYIDQLEKEIEFYGEKYAKSLPVKTIFFGGGTPSLLKIEFLRNLVDSLRKNFQVDPNAEISLEANPGTVTIDYLKNLKDIGFNRLSFGLQTSNPEFLQLLGRIHNHFQSIEAIHWAKASGFSNINLDLIYGLPGQSIGDWEKTLTDALELQTQHISLYALGIEENTVLFDWVEKGVVENPDPDVAAEMYELADKLLLGNGFECYEISNYFKKNEKVDFRCHHNMQYWQNLPYLGLGAGAHGYVENVRYENIGRIPDYIKLMRSSNSEENICPVITETTDIDHFTEMQETMMVGLRLVDEGVSIHQFNKRFSISPLDVFSSELKSLLQSKLIEIVDGDTIRLTKHGRLLGNQAFIHFVN
ncbi:MAG: radical SAM family heme chaperone HemW [Anaerolineaceae bacterium]|nr:radical SAM family heme chaperone HemW [Anaerolineaceae bacterium]